MNTAGFAQQADVSDDHILLNSLAHIVNRQCSGGMKVKNLGWRPDNDLIWNNVVCDEAGNYKITLCCPAFVDKAELYVSINNGAGLYFKAKDMTDNKITFTAKMKKGSNTIRLYNDHGAMPEIDWMRIEKDF